MQRALFFALAVSLWAQDYPEITAFQVGRDPVFQQYHQEVQAHNFAQARGREIPPILFFRYKVKGPSDLLSVAARFSHRYDTLATLNRIDRSTESLEGRTLLIPTQPGLFLFEGNAGGLQNFIRKGRVRTEDMREIRVLLDGRLTKVLFLPGVTFNSVERAWFLGILRISPVDGLSRPVAGPNSRISSRFGMRTDPFTGHRVFHNGVDIAAPEGTPVRAAAAGRVIVSGTEGEYGNLVVIEHEGGFQTWYGHLKTRHVRLNQRVPSGYLVGEVGSTGRSTGPHLHFEVRRDGEAKDPVPFWR